ncbi:hypothetical protein ACIBI4_10030 [Streptomyces sp. NPDC050418]|uniref:hypothetical protein n=1 Tax=Streptomyces sp. NPDC050418 TaxID=3365612 RepID=UPI0037B6B49E
MVTFLSLSTAAWCAVAAVITPVFIVLMRWTMPTAGGKRSVSLIPPAAGAGLAAMGLVGKDPLPVILYLYSALLLIFLIGFVPVRKWVYADTLRQAKNPDVKVQMHTPSLLWMVFSMLVAAVAAASVWMENT